MLKAYSVQRVYTLIRAADDSILQGVQSPSDELVHYEDEQKYQDGNAPNQNPNDDKNGTLFGLSPDVVSDNVQNHYIYPYNNLHDGGVDDNELHNKFDNDRAPQNKTILDSDS